MLQQEDSIAAGLEMASMPVFNSSEATKVGEQVKQFKGPFCAGRQVQSSGEKFLIKGMKTPLFSYQFAGSGWMVGRGKSEEGPFGGILANSMGLGKALETLACIAGHPPTEEDLEKGLFRTSIVVPANAVSQWIDETYKHGHKMSVAHYKASAKSSTAHIEDSSSWVTSYHEVMMHYPSNEGGNRLMKEKFYRVILDEAHAIKNLKWHTSASCIALTAKYRWALGGTPVHNRVPGTQWGGSIDAEISSRGGSDN
ncbi:SNF2 family N-terminal domain-containing protein, partial [Triangularia setosa]